VPRWTRLYRSHKRRRIADVASRALYWGAEADVGTNETKRAPVAHDGADGTGESPWRAEGEVVKAATGAESTRGTCDDVRADAVAASGAEGVFKQQALVGEVLAIKGQPDGNFAGSLRGCDADDVVLGHEDSVDRARAKSAGEAGCVLKAVAGEENRSGASGNAFVGDDRQDLRGGVELKRRTAVSEELPVEADSEAKGRRVNGRRFANDGCVIDKPHIRLYDRAEEACQLGNVAEASSADGDFCPSKVGWA
jgi:hypothetical protein